MNKVLWNHRIKMPLAVHFKLSQQSIAYISIQNKKLKKKNTTLPVDKQHTQELKITFKQALMQSLINNMENRLRTLLTREKPACSLSVWGTGKPSFLSPQLERSKHRTPSGDAGKVVTPTALERFILVFHEQHVTMSGHWTCHQLNPQLGGREGGGVWGEGRGQVGRGGSWVWKGCSINTDELTKNVRTTIPGMLRATKKCPLSPQPTLQRSNRSLRLTWFPTRARPGWWPRCCAPRLFGLSPCLSRSSPVTLTFFKRGKCVSGRVQAQAGRWKRSQLCEELSQAPRPRVFLHRNCRHWDSTVLRGKDQPGPLRMLSIPGPHLINHMDASHVTTKKGHTLPFSPLPWTLSPPQPSALPYWNYWPKGRTWSLKSNNIECSGRSVSSEVYAKLARL